MLVTIRPAPGGIGGVIAAPPSKSMAHRAVLCAALAVGRSHITHLEFSKDISATLSAAAQLCAAVDTGADDATVQACTVSFSRIFWTGYSARSGRMMSIYLWTGAPS